MSDAAFENRPLPIGGRERMSVGWWGVLCLIATEASLFAYLLFSYFYFAVELDDHWLPEMPSFRYALSAIILLILSSPAMWWGARSARPASPGHTDRFPARHRLHRAPGHRVGEQDPSP